MRLAVIPARGGSKRIPPVHWHVDAGAAPTEVCCLYATAPFVQPAALRRRLDLLTSTGAQYAFSVSSHAFPIQRAIRVDGQGRVRMFDPTQFNTRSRDLEEAIHDAGQFYWGPASAWLQGLRLFSPDAVAVHRPRHRVQDIDTPEDWTRAEWLWRAMRADGSAT